MKSMLRIVFTTFVLAGILVACSAPSGASQQDAVNTAVAQTQQVQNMVQATMNANALTSMPPTATPGAPVEYTTMTEEELTALIDQAVSEAVTATEQTTSAVATTTSDGTMTQDEVTYVYSYYNTAYDAVAQAEQLANEYYSLYADLANEMITAMNGIQSELNQMNSTLSAINTSLTEINNTLSQGLALAQDTINQLNAAAQQAQTQAEALKAKSQDLKGTLQTDQQNRLNQISQIQPNNIPTDRAAALQSGFQFIDAANAAMGDNKLSRDELMNLAQLGANAQAGFQNFGGPGGAAGGPDLSQFTGKFNEITTQFARGQMPQARGNLDTFERSLGQRPGGGGGPGAPGGGGNGPRH